jgi:hypothetical protein
MDNAGLGSQPPDISPWEIGTGKSADLSVGESSLTKSADREFLDNPMPSNEHLGIDEESLYIDISPEHGAPPIPTSETEPDTMLDDEIEEDEIDEVEDYESLSGDEIEEDDIVTDREPPQKPDANYDKDYPPMAVGTMYSDQNAFKLALATHATKYEFQYIIEKCDKSRYKVYCSGKNQGCRWRIHAATLRDEVTVKVDFCHNSICIHVFLSN